MACLSIPDLSMPGVELAFDRVQRWSQGTARMDGNSR